MCLIPGLPKLAFLAVAGLFWGARSVSAIRAAPPWSRAVRGKEKGRRGAGLRPGATAEARRADPRDRLPADSAGGREAGRAAAEPGPLAAPPPLLRDGFLVPPVHISDNLRLKPREYLFSLRGMEIGRWQTEGNATAGRLRRPQPPAAGRARRPASRPSACPPSGSLRPRGPGHRRRLLGGRCGHGDHHPSRRADPPPRLGAAGPRRDQAADGFAQ
jgi:flagellar biosynthesis protein FlhA